ncbi:hypothetical protein ACFQ0M_07080 [Kitasatospora aburaviensis]
MISSVTSGDVETAGGFRPATDGLDLWESLEGMRVELDNAAVVGPRTTFGEIPVVPQGSTTRTNRGGILLQAADGNPERVLLDDVLAPTPTADVGDTLSGATVGVLDYSFGNFKLLVTATPRSPPAASRPRPPPRPPRASSPPRRSTWRTWRRATRRASSTASRPASSPTSVRPTWSRWRRSRTTAARPTTAPSPPTRPSPG